MAQLDIRGGRAASISLARELVSGNPIVRIDDHVRTAALAVRTILRAIAVDGSPGARCRVAAARVLGAVIGEAAVGGQGACCARGKGRIAADDTTTAAGRTIARLTSRIGRRRRIAGVGVRSVRSVVCGHLRIAIRRGATARRFAGIGRRLRAVRVGGAAGHERQSDDQGTPTRS